MTWFKVDDQIAFHRKTVSAGNSAMGLWVRAGSWCAMHLTDGHVPEHMVGLLGTPAQARRLVKAGFWIEVSDGYLFHQWSEEGRQPTAQKVRDLRKKSADRQADFRERKYGKPQVSDTSNAVSHAVSNDVTNAVTNSAPTRPDPLSTYVPSSGGGSRRADEDRAALAQTGHTPTAHRLVQEHYATEFDRRPPLKVLSKAAVETDALLTENTFTEDEIAQGLAALAAKGLDPACLASIVNEVVNGRRHPAGTRRPGPATTEDKIAALQALKTGTDGPAPLRAITGGLS